MDCHEFMMGMFLITIGSGYIDKRQKRDKSICDSYWKAISVLSKMQSPATRTTRASTVTEITHFPPTPHT